jgi:peptidoglycan/LPS O-acetylase OafA/YrhL
MVADTSDLDQQGPGRHWNSLDALRGIAAFLVLTFHCAQISEGFARPLNPFDAASWLDPWAWFKYTPLRLLVGSGPSAVVLFFVLSGFVLSLPFLRTGRRPSYVGFGIKRLCRIYLPFGVAILGSAALYAYVRPAPIPGLSVWFNEMLWDRPLSLNYVTRNLMMTGLHPDMTLDPVMWSLVHELRISLVFPLLFLVTRRFPAMCIIGTTLMGVLCTAALGGENADSFATSIMDTGRFVFLFAIGIVVATNIASIRREVGRRSGKIVSLSWIGAVLLILSPGPTLYNYYCFVWGIGAAGLVALTVGSARADRALSTPVLVWLGRVSYSLYLVHLPLLTAIVHLTHDSLPFSIIIPVVVVVTLLCAELMRHTVELPSIRLGRILAGYTDAVRRGRPSVTPGLAMRRSRP